MLTYVNPAAVNNIGWLRFIVFGVFCTAMSVWVFLFVRETKARSPEEMDILFEKVFTFSRLCDIESTNMTKDSFDDPSPSDPKVDEAVEIESCMVIP